MLDRDEDQEQAVKLVHTAQIGIITGGPGVGKTTTLKRALETAKSGNGILLTCPTGKAARRLTEVTMREALTIHRALMYREERGVWGFDPSLVLHHDLVIVDEASMVDVELGAALVRRLGTKTRLILVGDANQLPSVGPGRAFGDLIDSGVVPVVRLRTLHRSAQDSWICRNAPVVLAGDMPSLVETHDFRWKNNRDPDVVATLAIKLVTESMPKKVDPNDIQVLSPRYDGVIGVENLNIEIQARVNPLRTGQKSWTVRARNNSYVLRAGDRVINIRNDYRRGVMNGEIGKITKMDVPEDELLQHAYGKDLVPSECMLVDFDGREVVYDREAANDLRLAYALTIHKSQGSEWGWVVVVCHSSHSRMLSRQLLYTAITRAKKGVVLVGDESGIRYALENDDTHSRNTTLVDRLQRGA